jgi:adenosylcobinamide-GDP ribazoletransferase
VNALRTAFAYFSILPVGYAEAPRAGALALLPLVGTVIGALAGVVGWLASLFLPLPFAVVTAFATSIVLSGAIHLDGFLDANDALFASVSPQRRFEILKDPRHGTYALAGLAIAVPGWLAAAAAIPPAAWPWWLAFCSGAARAAAVLNAYRIPYAAGGASARAFDERPNGAVLVACAVVAAACAWQHPWYALLVVPGAFAALLLGEWCRRRLDGVLVGDCYGAIIVVVEIALLACVGAALARSVL